MDGIHRIKDPDSSPLQDRTARDCPLFGVVSALSIESLTIEEAESRIEALTNLDDSDLTPRQYKRVVELINSGLDVESATRASKLPPKQYKAFRVRELRRISRPSLEASERIKNILITCLRAVDTALEPMSEEEQAIWIAKVRYPLHAVIDTAIRTAKQPKAPHIG